jgi:hypothetical protein
MESYAQFMQGYSMRGQHTADRAMTRYRHDVGKMVENNESSTGAGRWALGVPNAYGNATFAPNPTIRQQKWGAAHDMSSTKTDVESDLLNLGRPSARTQCGQFNPLTDRRTLTAMPEAEFPQTFARLFDPPCTLRGSGVNRWEWLCQNPQENVMMPFSWNTDTRHAAKDRYRPDIALPLERSKAARDHAATCEQVYLETAVPVARVPGAKDAPNFSNELETTSSGVSSVRYQPRGAPMTGRDHPDAPPVTLSNPAERIRAQTGVIAPPPPFSRL